MDKDKILETIKTHSEYEKNLEIALSAELPAYLKSLVDGFHSFRIGGYIPSFNDGDPCVFWLLEPEFNTAGPGEEDEKWHEENEKYKHAYYHPEPLKSRFKEIEKLIERIPKNFFTRVYGDYFQLLVTADNIDVNENFFPE